MKCKHLFAGLLAALILLGCQPSKSKLSDGSYSSVEKGFGGDIAVTLNIDKGKIANITIKGDDETPAVGQAALEPLKEAILESQSADVDVVSGASHTSEAVKAAVQDCLAQASGAQAIDLEDVKMADGSYTASAWGFSTNNKVNLSVEIADNRMKAIHLLENFETGPILQSAIDLLIPRMIEHQSVKIDSITGATASCSAIKAATEACLKQAITAAGGDKNLVAAFYSTPALKDQEETIDTDLLVIGMGGSGCATAVRAAEALYAAAENDPSKVHILAIDKAGKFGGTSSVTSSPMSVNPPSFVKKNGGRNYVDPAVLKADWMNYTEGDAKEWAIDYMMDQSGNAIDWLIGNGFVFGAPAQGLSAPYKLCVNYADSFGNNKDEIDGYFHGFVDHFTALGGKYMLETEATELLTNDAGSVIGVKAHNADGTRYIIHAKKVVLATGGFAGNSDMMNKYLSDKYYPLTGGHWNVYGMLQNDGKMLQQAIDDGAATYNIGIPPVSHIGGAKAVMHEYEIKTVDGVDFLTGAPATRSLNDIPMMMAVAPNAMAVNREGKRFVDETMLNSYGNWRSGPYFYTIWSNNMIDEIKEKGLRFDTVGIFVNQGGWPALSPIDNIYEVLNKAVEHKIALKGNSLEDLAKEIHVDQAVLAKTVHQYNEYCDTKKNPADGVEKSQKVLDLSGTPISSDQDTFEKVEGEGPYYAVIGAPWVYSTTGGLDVNKHFQVLDREGSVIDGLYAVGTDCMGVLFTEKKEYVTYGGADQGWAFTSGYLAGSYIADELK